MKFQEYVDKKDTPHVEADLNGNPRTPFSAVGMDQNKIGNTMTSLRRMLSPGGVAKSPEEKAAMRRMTNLLRSVVRRLMGMGMTADDLLMLFQSVTGLVTNHGGTTQTNFNQNRVARELRAATGQE